MEVAVILKLHSGAIVVNVPPIARWGGEGGEGRWTIDKSNLRKKMMWRHIHESRSGYFQKIRQILKRNLR